MYRQDQGLPHAGGSPVPAKFKVCFMDNYKNPYLGVEAILSLSPILKRQAGDLSVEEPGNSTDTRPKKEAPADFRRAQLLANTGLSGGADGARTRDLRRDRFKFYANKINKLALLSTSYGRHIASRSDTKRPYYATSTDTPTDTQFAPELRRDHNMVNA